MSILSRAMASNSCGIYKIITITIAQPLADQVVEEAVQEKHPQKFYDLWYQLAS